MNYELLLPLALYAETHYRFLGFLPSALFKKEPEIVFDMPRRLRPASALPVALLINDAARFPIDIESAHVSITKVGEKPTAINFCKEEILSGEINHGCAEQQTFILTIPRSKLPQGEIFINACLRYRRAKGNPKKIYTVINDNFVTSAKLAFQCFVCDEDYPGANFCAYGDLHCHSIFSRSPVEWGPPFDAIDAISKASGLTFAAITDHSYDLACDPQNYLRQDKNLRLWERYKLSMENYKGETVLIPSEEVSVLNSKGKIVHLCGLGISQYIPGTLDGARKNIRGDKNLTIEEAVCEIERQGGVSFAAHPGSKVGFFQSLFLRRGEWSEKDLCENLGGIQAANGDFFDTWVRAKNLWVSMLQKGKRIPILAGSDAHGDFNRYRAITIPHLQIREDAQRYMGFVRTGIYGNPKSTSEIISAIKNAATFVTNGPFVTICSGDNPQTSLVSATPLPQSALDNLYVKAISTKEFGTINKIRIIAGATGKPHEQIIANEELPEGTLEATLAVPAEKIESRENCYIRAEIFGKTKNNNPTTAASGNVNFASNSLK